MIRPSRERVLRWIIGLAMVTLIVSAGDLSGAIGDVSDVDNGTIRWFMSFAIITVALLVFVKYGPAVLTHRDRDGADASRDCPFRRGSGRQ